MSTFSAILSSLQDGKTGDAGRVNPVRQTSSIAVQRSIPPSTTNKRKAEDDAAASRKAIKLAPKAEISPILPKTTTRPVPQPARPATTFNGTIKSKSGAPAAQISLKTHSMSTPQSNIAATKSRGFASLMAKASAAQEASKAAGPDTIKHKPIEVVKRKERERLIQEAKEKEKQGRRLGRAKPIPGTVRAGNIVKGPNGKMLQRPKLEAPSYAGTMRAKSTISSKQISKQRGLAQDRYGGYASWSDLSEAGDQDDDGYETGSDMEEAGFDDMMEEELKTTRIAKLEDQKEQEAEERHRKEKLERKKKLLALSNSAAAAKKRY